MFLFPDTPQFETNLGEPLLLTPDIQRGNIQAARQESGSEWSTLIGREGRDGALIGRELYRTEIFSWCCYASSLMP